MKSILSAFLFFISLTTLSAQGKLNLVIFSEDGDQFYAVINGIRQNTNPETNVKITDLNANSLSVKIIFHDARIKPVTKNVYLEFGNEYTVRLKKDKKGNMVLRMFGEVPIEQSTSNAPVIVYHTTETPVTTNTNVTTGTNTGTNSSTVTTGTNVGNTTGTTNVQTTETITTTTTTTTGGTNNATVSTGISGNGTNTTVGTNVNTGTTATGTGTNENVNFNMNVNGVGVSMNVNVNENNGTVGTSTNVNGTGTQTQTQTGNVNTGVSGTSGTSTTTYSSTTTTTTTTTNGGLTTGTTITETNAGGTGMNTNTSTNLTNNNTTVATTGTSGCISPVTDVQMNEFKKSIASKSFSDSKKQVAQQIVKNNCLSSAQIHDLMKLFDFEADRLEFAKFSYAYVYDRNNYYKVNDAFDFESSIDELNEYIKKK